MQYLVNYLEKYNFDKKKKKKTKAIEKNSVQIDTIVKCSRQKIVCLINIFI